MNRKKNLTLVGFMGTGKTTCGRLVADQLGYELVDMDDVIEERAGKKISDIFSELGEPVFRRMECDLAQELSARDGLVIAAGGGVVLNDANIEAFQRGGVIVCLLATEETILRRVRQARHRPLLEDGEMTARIHDLLARRKNLYASVPLSVTTDGLDAETVAGKVLSLYSENA